MSKKLFILLQTLFLLGSITTAYAENMTVDVYESGQYKGTMTVPADRYQNLANSTRGTTLTVRPQPRPDALPRQIAAQKKMDGWNQDFEQRHQAAMAQQEQLKQQFAERQVAAQQKMAAWNQQAAERQKAAQAQQEKWKQQFDQRHADAQKGYDHWKATR